MTTFESLIEPLASHDSRIKIGRFTYGTPKFHLWADAELVEIGAFCSIAEDTAIFGGGEHNTDWVTTFPLRIALGDAAAYKDGHPASKGPTRIGNDVWIGYGTTILSGVTIGDGAVIGAGALVASDVPPYAMVAGNPAKTVKLRFSELQIEALLRIQWWNWAIEEIRKSLPLLCSARIDEFIQSVQKGDLRRSIGAMESSARSG